MNKQVLLNVQVPWQVSPSTPDLTLNFSELNQEGYIEFLGLFGKHTNLGEKIITLSFSGLGWIKVSPPFSDRSILDESAFDLTKITGMRRMGESISDWMKRFDSEWSLSNTCPDSQFYTVENSIFSQEVNAGKWGCKHFILSGERSSVEILARAFQWSKKN
ncbi:hypothetical protein [Hahella chejuensis]|uniref:hypothetical protein n=1 Tax=Hahella chejuensis TaxID=158327 RepID=UPI0005A18BA6|nr:hypothetical protein [Hahella chejuensis]